MTYRDTCTVDGCSSPAKTWGWCDAHYAKERRAGNPLIKPRGTATERFWSKVDRTKPDACWPWIGYRNVHGYGTFWFEDRHVIASRMAWELTHAPITNGLFVCHRCDNPPCCNPAHLFLGTMADNFHDAVAKGRVALGGSPRRTHCIRGHAFSPENTYVRPSGGRECLICKRARRV